MKPAFLASAFVLTAAFAACSDSPPGPTQIGPPASIELVATAPSAPANTEAGGAKIIVKDASGNPVSNQTVTFSVTAGGGSIQQTSATTGSDGTATIPTWRMGKRAEQQTLTATIGSLSRQINGIVETSYSILIRYYGTHPTDAQKVLFSNAANRIRGVVTDELQNVTTGNTDISSCLGQTTGTTTINETIDDLVIYATVITTGGANTIASAGPCYYRVSGADSMQTVLGVMRFSPTFMNSLAPADLENVIMHEMLHVVGVGSWWLGNGCGNCADPGWNLVSGQATLTPRFTGSNAKSECQAMGGTVTCANGPSVENDTNPGTGLVHWEKDVFGNELMVGFISSGGMPFSRLTIGSLRDIGLTVNTADFDDYNVAPLVGSRLVMPSLLPGDWERPLTSPLYGIDPSGRVTEVRRRP